MVQGHIWEFLKVWLYTLNMPFNSISLELLEGLRNLPWKFQIRFLPSKTPFPAFLQDFHEVLIHL